jgi:uncharacterized repeat protein (TIGR01451 family)
MNRKLAARSRARFNIFRAIAVSGAAATLTVGLAMVSAVVLPAQMASAAPGPAFTCATPTSFLSQEPADYPGETQLYDSEYGAGSVTYSDLGALYPNVYNALGFDTENDYLYATVLGTNDLLQIDGTGGAIPLGPVSGLPVGTYADGAFDGSGNYWVTGGNGSTDAYEIDVTSVPPAVITTLPLSGAAFEPIDFSFDYGYMWGLDGRAGGTTVYRLDLSTGVVTTFEAPSEIVAGQVYGAAWTYNNGDLGFSSNDTGDIYQISVANPSGTPTFALVSDYTGPVSGENDGAACAVTPTDLNIVKTGPATAAPGGAISWTLTVTNNGPGTSSGFAVSDDVPGGVTNVTSSTAGCKVTGNDVLCSEGTLADGDSAIITLVGTAPASYGTCFTNTATVTANESDPNLANNSSSVTTCTGTPSISLAKSANFTGFSAPGTAITYNYQVTNTGNLTLNPVVVTDPQPGLSAITCPDVSLAAGASENCTAAYTTVQADVDAGGITNIGTATGTPPNGPAVTATSTLSIPATQNPAIGILKSASITSYSGPGTLVTYSYVVTNTGNVTLTAVGVTDPMPGLPTVSCPTATLAPGVFETCTATYTTTQADVDNGSITNTGTATGSPPSGPPVTDTSSVTIPATQAPAIGILKSANVGSYTAPGTAITYSYAVSNSGNVTLTNVTVTDSVLASSAINCGGGSNVVGSLAPGASVTCKAGYTTTQADVDNGSIVNTGTATGTPPLPVPDVMATSRLSISATQSPGISIVKSASTTNYSAPGTPVTYSYKVTNGGNVTLDPVTVTDPMVGLSAISCPGSSLAPAASETCTATYTTTQANVDAGSITNTGTATATPPSGEPVSATSTLSIPATQTPGISLVKTASITNYSAPGTAITYDYAVTNTGNVTLAKATVTDSLLGSAVNCGGGTNAVASLAPGASVTCTAGYSTSQSDVDTGAITNTGAATASTTPSDPNGETVTASSTLNIPATQTPAISLVKSANMTSFAEPGTLIDYSYVVTNTGNVTLTSVGVTDPQAGLPGISCPDATLAPAGSETCTASYTTAQADVDSGSITNTGTATATPPDGPAISYTSTLTIPAVQSPAIGIAKTTNGSNGQVIAVGSPVTWSYVVTNSGNVTLANVTVTDNKVASSAINCGGGSHVVASLAPTASATCTAAGTTTAGAYSNVGTATGTPPNAGAPVSATSVGSYFGSNPSIGIVKSASITSYSAPGTPVTYSYVVTNTGNVTLTSVGVTDPMPGLSTVGCPTATLAPGVLETCTATYSTTQANVDAGALSNTGTAIGTPPIGADVTASSKLTVPATQTPKISLVKSASIASFDAAGTPVTYSYKVTNSGNVTLNPVMVTDPMAGLSAISCPGTSLAPAASETCTATYTTTNTNLTVGAITNTGTASGTAPNGNPVTATSHVSVPVSYPTETVLRVSKSSVTYGSETPETFSVTVSSPGGTPTGKVTISSSAGTLCTVTLSAGKGSCSLAAVQLPAGAYSDVVATYIASGELAGSSSSPAQCFSVTKDTTTTTVSVSPKSVTYGDESVAVVTVTVKAHEGEAIPNGDTATVRVGPATCTVTLESGTGTCKVANTALGAGSWAVSATYGGDANLIGSSATCSTSELYVAKDSTTTTVSESPTSVAHGSESAAIFTVKVTTHYGEAVPAGATATVTVGSTSCTVTLVAGTGTCKVANSALEAGSYAVSAAYAGNASLNGSSGSSATKLTVT